jgi:hypothetical protein
MALDRRAVRQRFKQRFTATRTAKDYVRVYTSLLGRANVKSIQAEPRRATLADFAKQPSEPLS